MTCRGAGLLLAALLGSLLPGLAHAASTSLEPAPIKTTSEPANAGSPVRVLVFESVPEFAARLRGQLSDLDVLLLSDAQPRPADLEGSLDEIAARHAADVIAWLGEAPGEPSEISVQIWIAGRDRIYARRSGPAPSSTAARGALARQGAPPGLDARAPLEIGTEQSANLETAALFVRGAVRSVLFDRSGARDAHAETSVAIESPLVGAAPAALSPAPAAASQLSVADSAADARPAPGSTRLAWAPHAGLDWSYAGLGSTGSWSLEGGLGLHADRFSIGLTGGLGLPESVRRDQVELSLRRQTLLIETGWDVLRLQRFALRPTLQAGAAWLTRSSLSSALGLAATRGQRSISALARFELVGEYALTDALRVRASSGLAWFSHVPRFLVELPPGRQLVLIEAWRWQPNAGIALGALF